MIGIDIRSAFDLGCGGSNFTAILLRLIAKADGENREKLSRVYPVEVRAVEIYQKDCPYLDEAKTQVDWDKIEDMARKSMGATGEFPDGRINEGDDGELRLSVGIDIVNQCVVMDFGQRVSWIGMPKADAEGISKAIAERAKELK